MWYIVPTQKWVEEVVKYMTEKQLKPENSKFMIAFFSSINFKFVDYFKKNRDQISSFSGRNFHIFTPLIYENSVIPDDEWRYMRNEFNRMGIPVELEPTFLFFKLNIKRERYFEPSFFAGFTCKTFKNFNNKLAYAVDACISINDTFVLSQKLSEIFLSPNIIPFDNVDKQFKQTITDIIPNRTIFISHSSIDKPFVKRLVEELSNDDSLKFWIDEREISGGDDIQKTITKNLHNSDYLLVVISNRSTQSSWVTFEISQFMSIKDGKNIIPLVISNECSFIEPIDNLIRRIGYLDFTKDEKWSDNMQELKRVLLSEVN